MRRLDPWAALVLGGLLAMGVVILLATPGPWQKVAHTLPPVRLETRSSRRRGRLRDGRTWRLLHRHRLAAPRCRQQRRSRPSWWRRASPGSHLTTATRPWPRSPTAPARAPPRRRLSGALGVSMDAWVALDRAASDLAIQAMFPMNDMRRRAGAVPRGAHRLARPRRRRRRRGRRSIESLSVALPAGGVRRAGRGRVLQLRPRVRLRAQRPHAAGRDVAGGGTCSDVDPGAGRRPRRARHRRARRGREGVARRRQPRGAAAPVAGDWASGRPSLRSSSRCALARARVLVVAPLPRRGGDALRRRGEAAARAVRRRAPSP